MSSKTPLRRKRLGRTRAATALAAAGALILSAGLVTLAAAPAFADKDDNNGKSAAAQDDGNNGKSAAAQDNGNNGKSAAAQDNGNNGKPTDKPDKKVHKSYVCKYVGTPGVDERLQTGQNPIWVDNHALVGPKGGPTFVGQEFSDKHGRSVVIVANTPKLSPEPDVSQCPRPTGPPPPTVTPTDVCPNIAGLQTSVPAGLVVDNKGNCVPPPTTPVDVCPNIAGNQASVPSGYQLVNGSCVQIAGEETIVPKPKPDKKPTKAADDEPTVKGVEAVAPPVAAPTAVAAGIGEPATSPLQTIAQMLVAGGMLLLVAGAWIGLGRRETGTHEA